MTVDERIRFAIVHKRLIDVTYNGRLRIVEPHDYGMMNGTAKLLVYQRSEPGASTSSRRSRGWRLLEVSLIEACVLQLTTFPGSRGPAHQTHHTWTALFARVS